MEHTFQFSAERLMERVMALSALKAVTSGGTASMIGDTEADALSRMAGAGIGMAALKLWPFAVDFSPSELTITLKIKSAETDTLRAFRLAEAAVAAWLAGSESEFNQLIHGAREALVDHSLPGITPCFP